MNNAHDHAWRARTTRRALLGSGAVAGGALLAPWIPGASRAEAAPAGAASRAAARQAQLFFADPGINFEVLFAFGSAAYGTAEFGEVATAVNRANARGGTYQAVYDAFWDFGMRSSGRAGRALARGHRVSARSAYLRAAQYLGQSLFFVLGTATPTRAQEGVVYRAMEERWSKAAGLFAPAFERVAIPYEGMTLPGYFLSPGPGGRRPTVILNNGSDGQNIDVYTYGGAAAIARGYNALIFEGPGQGSLLFEHNIPFRPDWEKVVTPVVDFLLARPDVDGNRIAIVGWSFAGELVVRAAAFERRLAAVVCDPGAVSNWAVWAEHFPPFMLKMVDRGDRQGLNSAWASFMKSAGAADRFAVAKRSEIYGPTDFYAQMRLARRFQVTGVVDRVVAPTLVIDYELEQFLPGQARQLYDLLRAPKAYIKFTAAEGAQYHDAPMAPQLRNETLFDWLDETFRM